MKKILSIALALSLVTTTLIGVGRDYFTSEQFDSAIDNTDLATMKFVYNGEKITLEKFVKDYVTEKIEDYIKNNPLSNFTNLLFPLADSITDFAVDKALSSEFINTTVKTEVHSIIDYFLYSDAQEAKERIKNGVTLAIGGGQTSRVWALENAIHNNPDKDFEGAVLASDAFFPFNDCVQVAANAGVSAIVQPGGSIKDQDSIDLCNELNIPMVFTGYRHFRH